MSKLQETVSIQIGQQMYDTFASLPNTLAHALADFVDNAVQSYLDTRDQIYQFDPSYRLRIDINVHCLFITLSLSHSHYFFLFKCHAFQKKIKTTGLEYFLFLVAIKSSMKCVLNCIS